MMIGVFVGINLLWGLTGGIDNVAHIDGINRNNIVQTPYP
jgi:rhomboid protease GluP